MNFAQALAEINSTTKRIDKINVARRKLNSAISFCVLDNEFKRDYAEQQIALDATQYTQAFALATMPRFRKFHYLKLTGTQKFLKVLPDSELFKDCDKRSRYYIAGSNVNVYLPSLTGFLDAGFFQYPPTLTEVEGNNVHWLLDVAPYMLIDWACAEVFLDIGDEKSWQTHRASFKELYLAFRRDQGISTQ